LRETKSRISGCAVSSKRVELVLWGYDKLRRVKKYQRKERKTQKERERKCTNEYWRRTANGPCGVR